jgi:hypothetical protein
MGDFPKKYEDFSGSLILVAGLPRSKNNSQKWAIFTSIFSFWSF